jgi:hypothetical protein
MRHQNRGKTLWPALVGLALLASAAPAADVEPLLSRIKSVGGEGKGNDDAGQAWRELATRGPDALPAIFAGFDGAGPVAVNYLRAAVDAIAEREVNNGRKLPADALEAFVKDTKRSGVGRRVAYEWLARIDATAPDRLLPEMLFDPGQELRRDAVARVLAAGKTALDRKDHPGATAIYARALSAARDADQVETAAKALHELGIQIDLTGQFGFLPKWWLIAPFDNTKSAGFDKVNPPELKVDLAAVYKGKDGTKDEAEAKWVEHTPPSSSGVYEGSRVAVVDFNTALGKRMGATGYAFTAVVSEAERPVEIRAGCNNAIKVWLNGQLVITRDEYHHGVKMDQYSGKGILKKGRNEILVKVCQNEQKDSWAQRWDFQLRVCDELGGAVPLTYAGDKPAKGGN